MKIRFYILLLTLITLFDSCGPLNDPTVYPWLIVDEKQKDSTTGGSATVNVVESELFKGMDFILNYQEHNYQYQRSNTIDMYAGYMTVSQNNFIFGGPLPTAYTFPNPYIMGPFGGISGLASQCKNAYFHSEALGVPEWKAIAQIMYAYAMHEVVDFYGAVPYEDYRALKENPPLKYESQKDVYNKIFADLKSAIEVLKQRRPTPEALKRIEGPQGGLSGGNWQRWVKFANSIRLRMAMNMVKVEPVQAQQIAEEAVNDNIGVLESGDEDIAFTTANSGERRHPLNWISVNWDDIRMGASLLSVLEHFKSPLLGVWFSKNGAPIFDKNGRSTGFEAESGYFAIRQGVIMIDKTNKSTGYGMYSTFKVQNYPRSLFKVTESLFIRAEGALRGWNMKGSAESLYKDGIKKALEENGVGSDFDRYIEQENLPVADHIDPYNSENDIKGRVTVGVKWNESDGNELKLEKIITQKYIANFPMGAEAWTTFRRTGYPRLFPVRINNWPGVNTELQLRRLPYIKTSSNGTDLDRDLGASNTGGARVWWDVPTEIQPSPDAPFIPKNF